MGKEQVATKIRYADFKYIASITIWADTELTRFGFALSGARAPQNLPFDNSGDAKTAARRLCRRLKTEAIVNGHDIDGVDITTDREEFGCIPESSGERADICVPVLIFDDGSVEVFQSKSKGDIKSSSLDGAIKTLREDAQLRSTLWKCEGEKVAIERARDAARWIKGRAHPTFLHFNDLNPAS